MVKIKMIKGRKIHSVFDIPSTDDAQAMVDDGMAEFIEEDRQIKNEDIENSGTDEETCSGLNRDGSPCRKKVGDAEFCHYHEE